MDIERFIKEHPEDAENFATQWQGFINDHERENPEILSINSKEEFLRWVTQHPEKNIDTSLWFGKEIIGAYSNLKGQQEDSGTEAQESEDQKRERQTGRTIEPPRTPRESVSQPTTPTIARQPSIQSPTRGFFNRTVGRTPSRLGGRLAGRAGGMAGRLVSRFTVQAGMAAGRFFATPPGWITAGVIALIILIIVIVFIIIMFAGGGRRIPTFQCVDADGKSVYVTNGIECAQNYAAYYTKQTGAAPPITAECRDKCTDFIAIVCDRNPVNNMCDPPPDSCGALPAFCFEYSVVAPRDGDGNSTFRHDCSNLNGVDYGAMPGFGVDSCAMEPPAPTLTP